MSREKQIEEMARTSCAIFAEGGLCEQCEFRETGCAERDVARYMYDMGYRKASDVAEEIFAEIDKHIQEKKKAISMFKDGEDDFYDGEIHALEVFAHLLADLKKKYTESEGAE